MRKISDEIEKYLEQVNVAVPSAQIVDALIAGGLRRESRLDPNATQEDIVEYTKKQIRKSILFHTTNPRGIYAELIRERNGKIGLWDWADERFQ